MGDVNDGVKLHASVQSLALYLFPRVILYNFFLIFAYFFMVGWGLGSYFGFLGLALSVDGVWGLWCGAFWVFRVWALYINIKE